ncbi:MAG: hypothetical protein ACR2NS_03780 [Gemmatimonadaceae bacterium]
MKTPRAHALLPAKVALCASLMIGAAGAQAQHSDHATLLGPEDLDEIDSVLRKV